MLQNMMVSVCDQALIGTSFTLTEQASLPTEGVSISMRKNWQFQTWLCKEPNVRRSWVRSLHWTIFHIHFVLTIVKFVLRNENKQKEAGDVPFLTNKWTH